MKRFVSKIMPVLVLLAVAAVGALGPDDARSVAQAAPGPDEVLIVNPAGSPARTTVVGPVTASIVGPVTATIANTPAEAIPVTVQGTPSVAVAGAVAVSGAVTVANDEAQPIPVRDIAAAPTPWVGGGQLLIDPGETFESEQFFTVPPGQRLVIEAFTIDASLPDGQLTIEATVLASSDDVGETFRFPLSPVTPKSATTDRFAAVEHTRINVGEGNGVIVSVSRNANIGTGLVNVALSGYLVAVH